MTDMGQHVFRNLPAIRPGKGEVFFADPRLIVVDASYNCRDMTAPDTIAHVDWLSGQIESFGFDPASPLGVKYRGDDIILIRGHCRLAACMKAIGRGLDLRSIPIMQMKGNDEITLLFDQQNSNNGLRLDEFAKGRLCERARRLGLTDIDIARLMGWKNASDVGRHIKMVEIVPEVVKKQVAQGDISATEAVKLVKSLPAGTDPVEAAKIIATMKEENKRLGVGKKTAHKVTAKTVRRDRPKPKPPAETKAPEPKTPAPLPSGLPATPETEGAAVSGAQSLDQLKETIAGLTAGADGSSGSPVVVEDEAAATAQRHPVPAGATAAVYSTPQSPHRIDKLLSGFIAATAPELALQYAKLCRELEETKAESGDVMQGQQELCVAADVIGQLRFPDEWDNAKASTELAQVA